MRPLQMLRCANTHWLAPGQTTRVAAAGVPFMGQAHVHRYGFGTWTLALNDMPEGLEHVLPPSDARRRRDLRLLEEGRYVEADAARHQVVKRIAAARALATRPHHPRWFRVNTEVHVAPSRLLGFLMCYNWLWRPRGGQLMRCALLLQHASHDVDGCTMQPSTRVVRLLDRWRWAKGGASSMRAATGKRGRQWRQGKASGLTVPTCLQTTWMAQGCTSRAISQGVVHVPAVNLL